MDSDLNRDRIDQFFASKKKRKVLSPTSKSPGDEREPRKKIEGSPSTKGCLERFLQNSKDGRFSCDSSDSSYEQKAGKVTAKRNLTLHSVPLSSRCVRDGSDGCLAQSTEVSGTVQRINSEFLPGTNGVSGCIAGFNSSEIGDARRNPELTEFATGFLSLYCGELRSSLNLQLESKEHSVQLEGESSKKRPCRTGENQQSTQIESSPPSIPIQANVISKFTDPNSSCLKKVIQGNQLPSLAGLRKCTHASPLCNECKTPSSSDAASGSRRTPNSSKGSSIVSPGEAFWNEAIIVADGLYFPSDSYCSHVRKDLQTPEIDGGNHTSDEVKIGFHDKMAVGGVREMNCDYVPDSAEESAVMHAKLPEKEASPFPVKHFDFGSEAEYLVKGLDTNDTKVSALEHKEGKTCEVQDETVTTKNITLEQEGVYLHLNSANVTSNTHDRTMASIQETKNNSTPASSSMKSSLKLSNWLPPEICNVYNKKGISELYPWQVDCLQVDGVLNDRNLIYCASTSAGKSLVAEILMLRRILATRKVALLVLPYVSICTEKAEHLEALLEPVDKHVRSFYGNQGGGNLPRDTSVVVCTIEKANSLINRLLEEACLSELCTVVIDELHMVGDQNRGYLLELMLTKLLYAAGEGNMDSSSGESSGTSSEKSDLARCLQIIGMSATLPNVSAVADWLHAALYVTNFRPVPLDEYIKVGNTIYNREMETVRTIPKVANLGGKDPDHVIELCNEVVQEGHSVLIFCSSRKGCETTARHVAKYLKRFSVGTFSEVGDTFDISFALDSLRRSPAGLDPVLEQTLPFGVAYHHAGLTVEERETVETCYRKGLVRVLTATSTLAAGVNLPARRVIFRQPHIGRDFIDGTRYKQMAGRAGRTGIDTKGESVLICKPEETKKVSALLNDCCPPLCSCLSEDRNGMTHAILEVVAGGIVQTANDINRYVRCTLLNSTKPFEDVVKSAQDSLRWLCLKKFLEWNEVAKLYSTTPLGLASFGSSLCPEESLIVLDDLMRAREGFVLASDLHLVYLVTPINVGVEPDWELYYERFMQLSSLDQSVGNRVGVQEAFLMQMAHGVLPKASNRAGNNAKGNKRNCDSILMSINGTFSNEKMIRVCKRLYVALILSRLVEEVPVSEVCECFKVARGMVQALQENAGRFASMVSVFCQRLGWLDIESLVSKFQNRVSFGVRAEIADLTTIPYVKGSRARALYMSGLRTPQAIAEASISEIMKALFESSSWNVHGSAQRHMQMGICKKIKNGARKIVLEKAEEARVVAFSAFKSLGFDIPQFSRPLISFKTGNDSLKELTSSSDEDPKNGPAQSNYTTHAVPSGGGHDIAESPPEVDRKKCSNPPVIDLGSSVKKTSEVQVESLVQKSVNHEQKSSLNIRDNIMSFPSHISAGVDSMIISSIGHTDILHQQQPENGRLTLKNAGIALKTIEKGPVSAGSIPGGLEIFLDYWSATTTFFFDVYYNKKSEFDAMAPFELHGIAICWENSPVYYLNIPKDLLRCGTRQNENSTPNKGIKVHELQVEIAKKRWTRISSILERKDVRKFTWNLKAQIKVLNCPSVCAEKISCLQSRLKYCDAEQMKNSYFMFSPIQVKSAIDLSIVAWIISPDEEKSSNPDLEKEVRRRLSGDAAASAKRSGRWKNQTRAAAHNGCCIRAAQIRALFFVLWKLLESENLMEPLMTIEVQLTDVLADMEIWGIGVDMDGCLRARHILGRKLKCLEKEAYQLAGKKFSLSMPADVSNILYDHLKLPMPEVLNGKQHPSTDKHHLDLLRGKHPLVSLIQEYRTLSKLFHSTLGSICSLARPSFKSDRYTLHGHWLQTSTATGRLSMEDPNLQCVEHMIEFNMNEDNDVSRTCAINARSLFVPSQDDWLLLTADYSQIELRLMAHFSKDSSLIKLLSCPESDVFTMISAKWNKKHESSVTTRERDETKRLVYGFLYGMGRKKLAENLDCTPDEAGEKIRNFKESFRGVATWLQDAVSNCQLKGYVETLKGRRRYLKKIKLGDSREKSKAERQAVNSICQGSAADIIKIAMIQLHDVIDKSAEAAAYPSFIQSRNFQVLKGRCRILLQVHDELLLEADPLVVKEAASLLRICMEKAVPLSVPLPVKLKIGKTWGTMEPFTPNS